MACPDDNVLVAMAEQSLPPAHFAELEVHIDSCESCRRIVAAAVAERSLAVGTPAVDEVDSLASFIDTSINERYVIDAVLGRGGMGTVYLARDVTLDREVALKLHRAGSGSERLHREAMAMAKLAHPNVVTVFEVGSVDDRLYVAMEYVRGETLRGWLGGGTRGWRTIIAMLLEVGNGLAAAHTAGLVHRDFKPENVLVGDDGRPRVGDFGLARVGASLPTGVPRERDEDRSLALARTALATPMTQTGALIGTPAYMAPEQLSGDVVDARCDQFAFCVVAWEALFGKRPFAGATLAALEESITAQQLQRPVRTEVPARVRAVLERGLAVAPSARYASMPALLSSLRDAAMPRTKRWLAVGVAGAVVLAGAGVAAKSLLGEREQEAACAAAVDEMYGVFDPVKRAQARVGFIATGMPGAAAAYERTQRVLLRNADALAKQAGAVCRAMNEPPTVTAARKECLDDRRRGFAGLVQLLQAPDKGMVSRATNAAWATYDSAPCDDPQTLIARAKTAKLTTPEVAQQLRDISTLEEFGRYKEALAMAVPLVEKVRAAGDRNGELQALLALGELYADIEDVEKTAQSYEGAIALAETMGRDLEAAIGYAALANHAGVVTNDYAAAHRAISLARAKLERLGGRNPAIRGELLMIEAQTFADENRLGEAERSMRAAAQTIEDAYGSEHPKLGAAYGTLSQILRYQNKLDESLVAAEKTLVLLTAAYGENHPYVAGSEMTLAQNLADLGRYAEARERYTRADKLFAKKFGEIHPYRAAIAANLGSLDLHEKNYAAAEASFRRALSIVETMKGPVHMDAAAARGDVARAIAASGRIAQALVEQRRVVAIYEELGKHGEPRLIGGLLDLGTYQLDDKQPLVAVATAERALGIMAKRPADANPAEVGEGKFLLARALWDANRERPRARKLAEEARSTPMDPELLTALDEWLAGHTL